MILHNKITILQLLAIVIVSANGFTLKMTSDAANQFNQSIVIDEGQIQQQFNPKTYQNPYICTNGMLRLIQFKANQTLPQLIYFTHNLPQNINTSQIQITVHPNKLSPIPQIVPTQNNGFTLVSGCPKKDQMTNQNYYNQIKIALKNIKLTTQLQQQSKSYQFSFLMNCDYPQRHKKFQFGYLIIGVINAALTIGVALHSRIWSIKFNQKPLRILLTWKLFLIITVILIVIGVTFYLIATQKQFKLANELIKYLGLVISLIFTFICMNEILYLFRPFKQIIWDTSLYKIRKCQLGSIIFALTLFIISLFVQNWILYTFLAACICVGSIKMLYFNSMQQAFYSLAISVGSVTIIAVAMHFFFPERSYNDYASQLSSPLFIQVPDLVDNLFKKCSWLPVVDIIVPGVLLSFLRTYDENFNTGWGGVYTVTGNLSFLFSTIIWITVQVFDPFSIPFSLITYSFLLVSICVVAFKRNQLKTLWGGYFLQQNEISSALLREDQIERMSVDNQIIDDIKIKQSFSNKGDQQEQHQFTGQLVNPKVSKSAFRTKRQTSGDKKNQRRISPLKKNMSPFSSSIR